VKRENSDYLEQDLPEKWWIKFLKPSDFPD